MYSVQEAVVSWLDGLGYSASTRAPRDTSTELVTIERTGGGVTDFVDAAQVVVQTWAATEVRAEEMALDIRSAAISGPLPNGVAAMRAENGPYLQVDPATRRFRYQTVYSVYCHV